MAKATDVPLDINHGIRDGQPRGSGIQHSIWAFNAIAEARGDTPVVKDTIDAYCRLENLTPDAVQDVIYGRTIYMRRTTGPTLLTLFEGGHEDLPTAACAWLEQCKR